MSLKEKILKKCLNSFSKKIINPYGCERYEYVLIHDIENYNNRKEISNNLKNHFMIDYVRNMSLQLIANEINSNNIAGAVAEVGVFRGDFAQYINYFFPHKSLYLFDTFEGFDKRDLIVDDYKLNQDFSETNIDRVLKKMKSKENCIIKKGYFPDTVNDVSETFCFVSLDTDLYNPILEGLNYFYSRLTAGGYIFVHDYNNSPYPGVKKAILEFQKENIVNSFPLPDHGGTLVITKSKCDVAA